MRGTLAINFILAGFKSGATQLLKLTPTNIATKSISSLSYLFRKDNAYYLVSQFNYTGLILTKTAYSEPYIKVKVNRGELIDRQINNDYN